MQLDLFRLVVPLKLPTKIIYKAFLNLYVVFSKKEDGPNLTCIIHIWLHETGSYTCRKGHWLHGRMADVVPQREADKDSDLMTARAECHQVNPEKEK